MLRLTYPSSSSFSETTAESVSESIRELRMLELADVGVAGWSFSGTRWGLESERPSRQNDNELEEDMLGCKMGRRKVDVERKVGASEGDLGKDPTAGRSIDERPRSVVERSVEQISFIAGSGVVEDSREKHSVGGVSLEL